MSTSCRSSASRWHAHALHWPHTRMRTLAHTRTHIPAYTHAFNFRSITPFPSFSVHCCVPCRYREQFMAIRMNGEDLLELQELDYGELKMNRSVARNPGTARYCGCVCFSQRFVVVRICCNPDKHALVLLRVTPADLLARFPRMCDHSRIHQRKLKRELQKLKDRGTYAPEVSVRPQFLASLASNYRCSLSR